MTRSVLFAAALVALASPAFAQKELKGEDKKIKIVWAQAETKNYVIEYESAVPQSTIDRIGEELEDILKQYIAIFKHKPEGKLKVKFMDNLNTYQQEGGDVSHPGFYTPAGKFLITYQAPWYDLIPIVYHEAFHQYLDDLLGGARCPTWFNEGMATYYEGMQRDDKSGKLDPRKIEHRKLRMVKDAVFTRQHLTVEGLIDASYDEFHDKEKESLHYTQSFALIYYLMQSLGPKKIRKYMDVLKKTGDAEKALWELTGKERKKLKKIEKGFLNFMLNVEIE